MDYTDVHGTCWVVETPNECPINVAFQAHVTRRDAEIIADWVRTHGDDMRMTQAMVRADNVIIEYYNPIGVCQFPLMAVPIAEIIGGNN